MFEKRISKSQFMMGRQCLKRLWLYNFRKDLMPPVPEDLRRRFEEGNEVGALAREYFPGGSLVPAGRGDLARAIELTTGLARGGAKAIYEGTFVSGNLLVRCDILKRGDDGRWELIEVKSSTDVREEHYPDAAVQKRALEGCGFPVSKVAVMHINGEFVKNGAIDPRRFFTLKDVTRETDALKEEVGRDLDRFMEVLGSGSDPGTAIGRHCTTPYECEFRGHCWAGLPEFSIYDIPRLSWEKKDRLRAMGILRFRDVPADFDLNAGQRLSLEVEKSGKPAIDGAAIRDFLGSLEYPLYHIDFETIMPAVPLYDASRPYQQIPFQVSLHVQKSPGAQPRHLEYLADAAADPRPGLMDFLLDSIGPKGSLLAYNAAFETARLKELAADFPMAEPVLLDLAERMKDLMKPFREQAYVHPSFKGRHSLKRILPSLIPDMTYEGLPIANGADAQSAYFRMLSGKMSEEEMERTRKDLKVYCGQDTLAMVKILEHLYRL